MTDFIYSAPTKVVFGRGAEEHVGELARENGGTNVLVHFGGKSALESGLVGRICRSLENAGIKFETLGGVVPNPRLSKVEEGIAICREKEIDMVIAAGGGSVIDSAKAIAMGTRADRPVWDFYSGKAEPNRDCLPVGAVLTLAAAGSEMSSSSVITNEDGDIKRGCNNESYRPKFAVLNPELTMTLPSWQTFSGIADIIMHTMERFFTKSGDHSMLTDSIAFSLIRTVIASARILLKNPSDYDARAEIMWAGSLSHNDLTGMRSNGDWATHQLEHELSGMFDVTHGAGLTAIWPAWARYVFTSDISRFAELAGGVFGISGAGDRENAVSGIEAMESFFAEIGMPTRIRDLSRQEGVSLKWGDYVVAELARKASFDGKRTLGAVRKLERADMENIYRKAW